MAETVDVVVIGGGLLGWSTAYPLVQAGVSVAVVDRADAGHATQAGAGIIAPGSSLTTPAPLTRLGKLAVSAYDRLLAQLAEDGAPSTGYDRVGMLFVARDEAEWERLPDAVAVMRERHAEGYGNIGQLALLTASEARALFPPLAELPGAIHVPDAARVDGRLLRAALRSAAIGRGAREVAGSAELRREGDRIDDVRVGGQAFAPGEVVIAGGAWSNDLGDAIGLRLPVYPQRGQIIHLDLAGTDTSRWPIVEGFYPQYLLAFPANRVVAGATREHDSGYEVLLTAGGVRSVLDEALRVAPGLAGATIAEMRIGLRPFSPDGLPILGRARHLSNCIVCTGHGPSGLTLGPVSGDAVAKLILGQPSEVDLTPFLPDRYQD